MQASLRAGLYDRLHAIIRRREERERAAEEAAKRDGEGDSEDAEGDMEDGEGDAQDDAAQDQGVDDTTPDPERVDDVSAAAGKGGTAQVADSGGKAGSGEGDAEDDGSRADDEGDGDHDGARSRSFLWRVRSCVLARRRMRVGVTPEPDQGAAADSGVEAEENSHPDADEGAAGAAGDDEGDSGGDSHEADHVDPVDDAGAPGMGDLSETQPATPVSPRTRRVACRRATNQRVIDSRPRDGMRWFRAWRALTRPVLVHPSVEPNESASAVRRPWSRALRNEDEEKLSKETASRVIVPEKRMNLIGSHGVLRLPFLSTVAFAAARAIGGCEWCRQEIDRVRARAPGMKR